MPVSIARADAYMLTGSTNEGRMSGLQRAFDRFGVIPKNIRSSLSGRSPNGRTVAMVLWQHRLDYKAKPISYSHFGWRQLLNHNDEPSTKERVEILFGRATPAMARSE